MLKENVLKILASIFIIGLIVLVVVVLLSNYISAFKQGGVAAPNVTAGTTTGYVRSGSTGSNAARAAASPGVPYPPSNTTMGMECPPQEMMPVPPGSIIAPTIQIPVMPMPEPSMRPPDMKKPSKKPEASPEVPGIPIFTPSIPQMGRGPQMPDLTEYEKGWQNVFALLYEMLARMFKIPYTAPAWNFY